MIAGARLRRRQPREPRRAELRSRRAARHQPGAELRTDRRVRRAACAAAGVAGINFDLIYGLPLQTVDSCLDTVAKCVELRPDRFSVFGYAHVPSFKKHQRKIAEASLPDSIERHRQSETIAEALLERGLRPDRARSFRPARRQPGASRSTGRQAAAQFPGLHRPIPPTR